jgi:hypothetical protein
MSKNEWNYPEINKTIKMQEKEIDVVDPELESIESQNMPDEPELDESKELTEEEKREIIIQQLKDSKKTYHPKKNFGVAYKKARNKKNKVAKQSRKTNRK